MFRISKISNSVGRNDNFLSKARKLSILPTELDIFDVRQHYIRILYKTNCKQKIMRSITSFEIIFSYTFTDCTITS